MPQQTSDVCILKRDTCPSLSGRSELTYEFGYHEESKAILFRIADNTGAGHFCDSWMPLDAILQLLDKAKEPLSLSLFKGLYPSKSLNNYGFLGSVLVAENLIICEKRRYLRKADPKAFMAGLNKLAEPTKKRSAAKKS